MGLVNTLEALRMNFTWIVSPTIYKRSLTCHLQWPVVTLYSVQKDFLSPYSVRPRINEPLIRPAISVHACWGG